MKALEGMVLKIFFYSLIFHDALQNLDKFTGRLYMRWFK